MSRAGVLEVPGKAAKPVGLEQKTRLFSAMWGWNKKSAFANDADVMDAESAQ